MSRWRRTDEETYDGQMNAPLPVGSAKPGTHATYVLLRDEVASLPISSFPSLFSIRKISQRPIANREPSFTGEGNILKDFYFDEDEWE